MIPADEVELKRIAGARGWVVIGRGSVRVTVVSSSGGKTYTFTRDSWTGVRCACPDNRGVGVGATPVEAYRHLMTTQARDAAVLLQEARDELERLSEGGS